MARNQRNNAPQQRDPNPPAFIAWHVNGKDKKSLWTRVGAAWDHKDGEGLTLQLDLVPIDGRIVLRAPQAEEQGAPDADPPLVGA